MSDPMGYVDCLEQIAVLIKEAWAARLEQVRTAYSGVPEYNDCERYQDGIVVWLKGDKYDDELMDRLLDIELALGPPDFQLYYLHGE